MKTPMLVGLNDSVTDSALVQNIRNCFSSTNSETDMPLDYKYLSAREAWSKDDKERINISLSIWANLHGFIRNQPVPGKNETYGYTKPGVGITPDNIPNMKSSDGYILDLDHPTYTSLRYVPMFTDSHLNKIFVHIQDNRLHNVAWWGEMYGSKNKSDFIWIEHENKRNDTGWPERTFASYAFIGDDKDYYNIVKRLEAVGVGKQKLNKPVIVSISRDKGFTWGDVIPIITYLLDALQIASSVIGLGTVVEGIKTALNTCLKLASNPNTPITTEDIKNIGNAISPTLLSEGGAEDVKKYLTTGTEAYNAYKKKDYMTMAKLTGINRFDLQKDQLFDMNLLTQNLANYGTKDYDKQSGTMQNVRNLLLIDEMVKAGTNPTNSNLLNSVNKEHSLTKSDEAFAYMTMVSGGGYSGGLPTNIGNTEVLSLITKDLSMKELTPMVHAQFMKASFGLPTGTNAFEELLLTNIENQIITKRLKEFTIPAQLPAFKANCIKEHLQKYGITVFYSGFSIDSKLTYPKEFTFTGRTNVRVMRNFK